MNSSSNRSRSVTGLDPSDVEWREREQTPTECVIDAIAAETGIPPTSQEPLYESIDPDALDDILESASEHPEHGVPLTVSFSHENCTVRISADGELSVTQQSADR